MPPPTCPYYSCTSGAYTWPI